MHVNIKSDLKIVINKCKTVTPTKCLFSLLEVEYYKVLNLSINIKTSETKPQQPTTNRDFSINQSTARALDF